MGADRGRADGERGDAVVEFIGFFAVLVVPVVYIIVAASWVQAAVFATDAGAREAVRIIASHPDDGEERAQAQVGLAFADFGVVGQPVVEASCDACASPGGQASVTVSTVVPLPLVPRWLGAPGIPVQSSAVSPVQEVDVDG